MQEKINKNCYSIEYRKYNKGILDDFIDATYIITMTNSIRIMNIENQLKKYIPTKKIYIIYNEGYKRCNKILPVNIPPYDLTDAYFYTIRNSLENNFNNILILEDDFILSDKIIDKNIQNEIKNVLDKNINNKIYFNLGPIPLLFYPNINPFNNIYKSILITVSHGIIYNRNIQYDIMKYYDNNIKNWDIFLTLHYKSYFYKNALCYQLFTNTDNQKYWLLNDQENIFNKMSQILIINFFSTLKLDKNAEEGFRNIYIIFFIFNYIFFIGICYLIFIGILNFRNYLY
jgi:hypothetical protein